MTLQQWNRSFPCTVGLRVRLPPAGWVIYTHILYQPVFTVYCQLCCELCVYIYSCIVQQYIYLLNNMCRHDLYYGAILCQNINKKSQPFINSNQLLSVIKLAKLKLMYLLTVTIVYQTNTIHKQALQQNSRVRICLNTNIFLQGNHVVMIYRAEVMFMIPMIVPFCLLL